MVEALTCLPETVPRRAPEVLVQHFAEESLLLEPASSFTCALNPTGAAVWELIDARRSVAEIAAAVAQATGADAAVALRDVRHFVDEMSRLGFVRLSEGADGDGNESFAKRLKRLLDATEQARQRYVREVDDANKPALFVASDPVRLFGALQAVRRYTSRFVELGAGLGGNSLLAALLGYERVTGIEHDPELARRAAYLAAELGLAERLALHTGSFFPTDYQPPADADAEALSRYYLNGTSVFDTADVTEHDCWLATPFPNSERLVEHLFEQHANPGSLLLVYVGIGPVRIRTPHGEAIAYHGPDGDTDLARLVGQS